MRFSPGCVCCGSGASSPFTCCGGSAPAVPADLILTVTSISGDVPSFWSALGVGGVVSLTYDCTTTVGSSTGWYWKSAAIAADPGTAEVSYLLFALVCDNSAVPAVVHSDVKHHKNPAVACNFISSSDFCGVTGVVDFAGCAGMPNPFSQGFTVSYTFPAHTGCCENMAGSGVGSVGVVVSG